MTKLGRALIMKVIINGVEYIVPQLPINDETVVNGKINVSTVGDYRGNFIYPTASDIGLATMVTPGTVLKCGNNKCTIVNTYENLPSFYGSYFGIDAIFEFGGIEGKFTLNNFYTRLNAKDTFYDGCYQYLIIYEDNYVIGGVTRLYLDNMGVSVPQTSAYIEGKIVDGKFVLPQPKNNDWTLWILFISGGLFDGPTNPYEPGGSSGPGGGGGSFDNTSTPINIPNLPSISAASTGFISLFNPTLNQLNELASYLWSDLFDVNGWKKLFADPMDAILGLSIVPVAVPSGGIREVKVGNIGTGISLTVASSQFVEVDCGSIDVNEYWGAYLDYEPYTQAQIFLPYIGTRPISVDEIMGKTVRVVYHVDILTGACCCFVKCGDSVLYTYNGQCSIPIPITGANYTSVVNGVISVAASVGSLVASGGSSAPTAIPAIASSAVNQMKPQVEKSGSISGSAGVLNMQTPYLILIRPRQALPSKQNEFIGYPSLITVQLTELSGYTEVQSIHLENIPATQEELAEIESLLEGGVIF